MAELPPEMQSEAVTGHEIEFDQLPMAQQFSILIARQEAARTTLEQVAQGIGIVEDLSYEAAREQKELADRAIEEFKDEHGLTVPPEE